MSRRRFGDPSARVEVEVNERVNVNVAVKRVKGRVDVKVKDNASADHGATAMDAGASARDADAQPRG